MKLIGLTENPQAMRRWMLATSEVIRITDEFEKDITHHTSNSESTKHHEQVLNVQTAFQNHVLSLSNTMKEMANPFLEDSKDLIALDTKNTLDTSSIDVLNSILDEGKAQYHNYVKNILTTGQIIITTPLSKNNLTLFNHTPEKSKSKQELQMAPSKSDLALFSRLYIACQSRDGNLDEFFHHENQSYPPSLSAFGSICQTNKSDLLHCLKEMVDTTTNFPSVQGKFFDGAARVNMLQPVAATTFQQYASEVFIPYITPHSYQLECVDIVWDVYKPESLKCD